MPVAPFAPLIGSGLGMLFGGKKSDQPQMTPQQQATYGQAMQTGKDMSSMSKYLMQQSKMGAPAYGKAVDYYSTLLGGDRAKMQQAVAPAAGQISDTYRGAQANLERMGIRGGGRDQAMAELNRQQAGQLGQLTVGMQPMAAQQLGQLGQQGMGFAAQGLQGLSSAGNLYSSLLGQQTRMADTQYDRNKEFGGSLGSLITSGLKGATEWWANRGDGGNSSGPWRGVPYR